MRHLFLAGAMLTALFANCQGISDKNRVQSNDESRSTRWNEVKADGVTDDSRSLRNAIDAGATTDALNRKIRAGDISFKSNTDFRNALIVNFGEVSSTDAGAFVLEGINNVTFENIVFDQDLSVAVNKVTRACLIKNSKNIRFKNCTFKNWTEQAIRIDGSQYITVESCLFENCNRGSAKTSSADDDYGAVALFGSSSKYVNVTNSKFINGGTGISSYLANNVTISSNFISLNPANVSGMGVWIIGNSNDILIHNNQIENPANEGVVVTNISNKTGGTKYQGKKIIVTANSISNAKYAGISADVGFEDINISDNMIDFSKSGSHGIYVRDIKNAVCSGNIITAADGAKLADMIFVERSTAVAIDNNVLTGGDVERRLFQNQNSESSFTNNKIYVNAGQTGLLIYPGNGNTNIYTGNLIKGNSASAKLVNLSGDAYGTIDDSIIKDNIFSNGGAVNFGKMKRSIVMGNIFKAVSNKTVINDGECEIGYNYGLKNN